MSSGSIPTELCLACSGSALSGSQRLQPRKNASSIPTPKAPSNSALLQPITDTQNAIISSRPGSLQVDTEGEESKETYALPEVFRTKCCQRPICAACLNSNPRLARYVPCLACLGGVRAVAGPSNFSFNNPSSFKGANGYIDKQAIMDAEVDVDVNLNGALRDRDVFVVGDEDDDSDDAVDVLSAKDTHERSRKNREGSVSPPPAYSEISSSGSDVLNLDLQSPLPTVVTESTSSPASSCVPTRELGRNSEVQSPKTSQEETEARGHAPIPRKHYIQKDDTLRGLALRYGVDGRTLCRLNNLPPSTLTTTPHLLHTRTVLKLPPSTKPDRVSESSGRRNHDPARECEIELEKTAKRLQLITKEADWDVAKAYAVLAQSSSSSSSSSNSDIPVDGHVQSRHDDLDSEKSEYDEKATSSEKEKEGVKKDVSAQERALDAYLDDDVWEVRERAAGRGPHSSVASTSTPRNQSSVKTRF